MRYLVMLKHISILVDNNSWILSYAEQLLQTLAKLNYNCVLVRNANDIPKGDVCFLLGCTKIVPKLILKRNTHNLVVHESALPSGKGFAPMSWQILANENKIPVCLIEASENVDSGHIWLQDCIELNGFELHDEWRKKQGLMTIKLAKEFIEHYEHLSPTPQTGEESFFERRTIKDSELDISKNIKDQFNLLID